VHPILIGGMTGTGRSHIAIVIDYLACAIDRVRYRKYSTMSSTTGLSCWSMWLAKSRSLASAVQ